VLGQDQSRGGEEQLEGGASKKVGILGSWSAGGKKSRLPLEVSGGRKGWRNISRLKIFLEKLNLSSAVQGGKLKEKKA